MRALVIGRKKEVTVTLEAWTWLQDKLRSRQPAPKAETLPTQPLFCPGDLISNRYRVIAKVGEGGMGCVYEVTDRFLPERGRVALKTIRPELAQDPNIVARFEREVRLSLSLAHPNVCRTYDLGRHGDGETATLYLTMEFLSGGRLSDWLRNEYAHRAMSQQEALPLFSQMAAGLSAIHAQNIVHRDFKPGNVMLSKTTNGCRAVITDLGLARALEDGGYTRPGAVMGTAGYMAPEGSETCAADVYSLGVTMLEMLTGKLSAPEGVEQALCERGVEQWLRTVVAKCCEREPLRRYSGAGEVVRALEGAVSTETILMAAAPGASPARRKWLKAAAVAALLVTGAVFAALRLGTPKVPARALELTASASDRLSNNSFLDAGRILEQAVLAAPHYALAHAMLADADNELELTGRANREMNRIATSDLEDAASDERIYIEGVRLTLTRDYAAAAEQFRRYYQNGTPVSKPARAVLLGRSLEKARKPADAAKAYASAGKRGGALLSLAVLDSRQQRIPEALAEFDEARSQFDSLGEHGAMGGLQYQLGAAYNRWNRLPEAEAALQSCVEQTKVVGDVYDSLRCRQQLAVIALRSAKADEDYAAVRSDLEAIVDEAGQHGFRVLQARASMTLGQTDVMRNDVAGADHSFSEASALAEGEQATRVQSSIELAAADLHLRTQQPRVAEREAAAAAAFYEKDGALKEFSQALLLQGRAMLNQHRPDDALKKFQQERAVASKVSTGDEAQAWAAVGTVYEQQERYPEAAIQFQRALELAGTDLKAPYYRVDLAQVLAELGRWREARSVLQPVTTTALLPQARRQLALDRATIELVSGNPKGVGDELSGLHGPDAGLVVHLGEADLIRENFRGARSKCQSVLAGTDLGDDRQIAARAAICVAEATLRGGDAPNSLEVLSRYEPQWATLPVELLRALALRSAGLIAVGRKDESRTSVEAAKSAVGALIALWGPQDVQSFQGRADIRGNQTFKRIGD